MAVAVKTSPETTPRSPVTHLAVNSLLGALYLLFAVGTVLTGLPVLWNEALEINKHVNEFLSGALLLMAELGAIVGLFVLGRVLEGPHPQRGQRAGTFVAAAGLFLIGLITLNVGNWMATRELGTGLEMTITLLVAGGLLYGMFRLFLRPAFSQWLTRVEDHGWFHATSFKANQGLRVRRGTVIALVVLVGCGIYTMVSHHSVGYGDWAIDLPWTEGKLYLPILLNVEYTVPLVVLVVFGWLSWRVVNWPMFADFLIATEAEMNKVSWTTRKRLIQDTIVVLVTVVFLTVFLFVVDILWIKILNNRWINVLQVDLQAEKLKHNEQSQW